MARYKIPLRRRLIPKTKKNPARKRRKIHSKRARIDSLVRSRLRGAGGLFSVSFMNFSVWIFRGALAVLLLMSLNGCMPSSQGEVDEEKEPHFIAGRNAINSRDFAGAIEEFEKALEVNPRNSRAHAELGWLYEEKESDAAAAIYHYQKYLKLRPESRNAEVIRQRIINCKQDLAKTVLPLPITPGMQRQFDQLFEENKRLKDEIERWKAYAASRAAVVTNPTSVRSTLPNDQASSGNYLPDATPVRTPVDTHQPSTATMKTHIVQAGETPAAIARRYGVRLTALLSANPGLEPRHMRVGQTINVPAR